MDVHTIGFGVLFGGGVAGVGVCSSTALTSPAVTPPPISSATEARTAHPSGPDKARIVNPSATAVELVQEVRAASTEEVPLWPGCVAALLGRLRVTILRTGEAGFQQVTYHLIGKLPLAQIRLAVGQDEVLRESVGNGIQSGTDRLGGSPRTWTSGPNETSLGSSCQSSAPSAAVVGVARGGVGDGGGWEGDLDLTTRRDRKRGRPIDAVGSPVRWAADDADFIDTERREGVGLIRILAVEVLQGSTVEWSRSGGQSGSGVLAGLAVGAKESELRIAGSSFDTFGRLLRQSREFIIVGACWPTFGRGRGAPVRELSPVEPEPEPNGRLYASRQNS